MRLNESQAPPPGRWMDGRSIDGKGTFNVKRQPGAMTPKLSTPRPDSGAQMEQMMDGNGATKKAMKKVKEAVT